jgi:tRNA (guanine37-N1)-methyltransferase
MIESCLKQGVIGRAIDRGLIDVRIHDLRDFTEDRHRVVDDMPYGGGPGMVLKCEPIFRAVDSIVATAERPPAVILTSPQGKKFTHQMAEQLSRQSHLIMLCGRYEGVDERVREQVVTEEISIGDYVLSGGELPALVVLDAVMRLVPGVVGEAKSVAEDSFVRGLLDFPHYTRPSKIQEMKVPEELLTGNHEKISRWRKQESLRRTLDKRPDLLSEALLDDEERGILDNLLSERKKGVGV